MPKRILITGATGFVGANLARRLLTDGHEIHLLVRSGYAPWRIDAIRDHIQIHEVNLADDEATDRVVQAIRPEWIFHLAAYGAYSSQTNVKQIIQTNFLSTVNLVEACLRIGFETFVNTGSSSEYGFKDHAPSEREWLEPNSYYAVTKASATLYCRFTAQSKKVNLPTLRLYSVYGPFEEPTRLMPTLIIKGLDSELPPLVNPDIARDYIFSEDVEDVYLLAATRSDQEPGAVYNVGTGIQTTLRDVVDVARRTMDIRAEPQWGSMADRKWDTSIWVAENGALRHDLGWQPRYTFEQGLARMVAWFRENSAMQRYYRENRLLPK